MEKTTGKDAYLFHPVIEKYGLGDLRN